jgi:hypothetical protein
VNVNPLLTLDHIPGPELATAAIHILPGRLAQLWFEA